MSTVNRYISQAQLDGLNRYQYALYRIMHLGFWNGWRAQQIAEEATGCGPYWNPRTAPKTLLGYYVRYARWKVFGGRR